MRNNHLLKQPMMQLNRPHPPLHPPHNRRRAHQIIRDAELDAKPVRPVENRQRLGAELAAHARQAGLVGRQLGPAGEPLVPTDPDDGVVPRVAVRGGGGGGVAGGGAALLGVGEEVALRVLEVGRDEGVGEEVDAVAEFGGDGEEGGHVWWYCSYVLLGSVSLEHTDFGGYGWSGGECCDARLYA